MKKKLAAKPFAIDAQDDVMSLAATKGGHVGKGGAAPDAHDTGALDAQGGGMGAGKGAGGSGGGGSGGGGKGSSGKGDLYSDLWILKRDLDARDGGGNGEPVRDGNGNPILIGSDGREIFLVEGEEGDWEVAPEDEPFVQEVELERANVARAPTKVLDKALKDALTAIDGADDISTDAAGRIVVDGDTIDSPLANLAMYKMLMKASSDNSWNAVTANWTERFKTLAGPDLEHPDWDPSSLLAAAFSKFVPITLDAVIYENNTLGVNKVAKDKSVDYFDFTESPTVAGGEREAYDYDRADRYGAVKIAYFANTDDDPDLEYHEGTVLDLVFGGDDWEDANPYGGVDDFAQAAEDARAVIYFTHENGGYLIS